MAKKKSRYPVVRQFPISGGAAATNTIVDTARNLSVINRRLMRFGRYYEVKFDLRPDWAGGDIEVYALRDDWALQKAFQMAYQAYLNNTMDERESLGTNVARYEDFRIADGIAIVGGKESGLPVMMTSGGGFAVLTAGEFELSAVVDTAQVEKTFTLGLTTASQYGIMEEYNHASNADTSPDDPTTDMPYANLFNEHDVVVGVNLQNDGNAPPYDSDGVNELTPWVRVGVLGSSATGVQRLSTGYFTAPMGLVLLKGFSGAGDTYPISMEVKSGNYKGVHAPSMVEVATVNRKRRVVK